MSEDVWFVLSMRHQTGDTEEDNRSIVQGGLLKIAFGSDSLHKAQLRAQGIQLLNWGM